MQIYKARTLGLQNRPLIGVLPDMIIPCPGDLPVPAVVHTEEMARCSDRMLAEPADYTVSHFAQEEKRFAE